MTEAYLDNASTTRAWPEVIAAVSRVMGEGFGNASSLHWRGLAAAREVSDAAREVAALVGSGSWKVVFTSGGSEADGLAVLGSAPRGKRDTVVSTTLEHSAVEQSLRRLETAGCRVVEVAPDPGGVLDPERVFAAVDERTALVAINHVANELGTVQPVAEIAERIKSRWPRCRVHVDAVQAAAQLPRLDYPRGVDSVAISAHKLHGPQGVGALLVREDCRPRPQLVGGGQQDGLRPGTLGVAGIAGFGVAARLFLQRRSAGVPRMVQLAGELIAQLLGSDDRLRVLGDPTRRAPGIAVLAVPGVRSEVLLHALEMRGVLAASSSACHASRKEPPPSLVAAGLADGEGALRLSLSIDTREDEVRHAAAAIPETIAGLRAGRAGGNR